MSPIYERRVHLRYIGGGELKTLELPAEDVDRLVAAFNRGFGSPITVDADSGHRYHINPMMLAAVEEPIARVMWWLKVAAPDLDELYGELVDGDYDNRVWDLGEGEPLRYAIHYDGLPDRAPAWLLKLRDGAQRLGWQHVLEVKPSDAKAAPAQSPMPETVTNY